MMVPRRFHARCSSAARADAVFIYAATRIPLIEVPKLGIVISSLVAGTHAPKWRRLDN